MSDSKKVPSDVAGASCPSRCSIACQDSSELLDLLGKSQIFTKEKRIEVAFYTNEEAHRFRDLIWAMRRAAKASQ